MLEEIIRIKAAELQDTLVQIRRHLHAHPELSYHEYETCKYVQHQLEQWSIPTIVMADTGVVGLIEGKNPNSRVMALRADMDALPIEEENEVAYKSTNPGIMHACGHDVHTTCLLGAAKILQDTRDHWEGTVKLIFQPGEERNPGGASLMIRDGVLQNPAPEGIVALHVHPGLPTGSLSFRHGTVMASADELYITVESKGGHAAAPHLTSDTILAASQLVISLQQIVSRNNNPFNPTVLSITSFQGGHTTNVIPTSVKLMGTLRCMDEQWRKEAHALIRRHIQAVGEATGTQISIHIDVGYPTVLNNEKLNASARKLAADFLGTNKVSTTEMRMGAEDFGYYAQLVPACFFRLGVMNKGKGITSGVHTPTFNIDEDAIETGAATMALLGARLSYQQ